MKYDFKSIEQKWQKAWEENHVYEAKEDCEKPKYFALVEFPYPSGAGLHVGHTRSYTAVDIIARKKRMQGYNVLYPIGWDAFGLPTENYAIKNKVHPALVTEQNINHFRQQIKSTGISFDWSREINTTDPEYYKWTQWIFLQLYKRGLAYKGTMPVNWCPSCKCVLANEEAAGGVCERCGSPVEHREKSQWMLKITAYADRLINDLELVDYPNKVKAQQINWIGRSNGAKIDFNTSVREKIEVFTTRPDTIFGATYLVLSPEHQFLFDYSDKILNYKDIEEYKKKAAAKSELERTDLAKEKTGVKVEGIYAVNPANNDRIPIYVSDYVLMTYGTGAIMAVPAHDERDHEFAVKFDLPITEVISGGEDVKKEAFTDTQGGVLINSGFLNGLSVAEAKKRVIKWLEDNKIGSEKVNYKLRDWVFSRQRYWGEPIPMIFCRECQWVPVPDKDLPVKLPDIPSYEPTENGESPLAAIEDWVHVKCPRCGKDAVRETDTMPNWAGSSWYFMRYLDPHNSKQLASQKTLAHWLPVDVYNGGMEHTTLHLLYSRFWYKFLNDIGVAPTSEPYMKRISHGMILAENGEKMSKSRGNVVNPDDIIEAYGADTLRLYEMFIGDYGTAAPWSQDSIKGCKRFLEKVWTLAEKVTQSNELLPANEKLINKTIKKVEEDIDNLKFNTAIAALMTLVNSFYDNGVTRAEFKIFLKLFNLFAPHICQELWTGMGENTFISLEDWPKFDTSKLADTTARVGVQVNGKFKCTVEIPVDCDCETAEKAALACEKIKECVDESKIAKIITVPNRIINIIVK